jgi:hypothetical protein
MKYLTIKSTFMPINEDEFELFERKNNILMPDYLKEFFTKYNGAEVNESFYGSHYLEILPLFQNKYASSVEDFLPWIRDPEFKVGRNDLIPFAIDPGGIAFLVSIGGDDEGVVYYSAVGLDENPLRKLANSFEEFINELKSEEES